MAKIQFDTQFKTPYIAMEKSSKRKTKMNLLRTMQ